MKRITQPTRLLILFFHLKNYIGEDYAGVPSTLEDRHAIAFGLAFSCKNPVLIRLDEREGFLGVFRAAT